MLEEMPYTAIPLVFRLLGETGAHAPVINDVVLTEAGRGAGETVPLPYAGGAWVVWERTDEPTTAVDDETPVHRVSTGADAQKAQPRDWSTSNLFPRVSVSARDTPRKCGILRTLAKEPAGH
jgi:hypothetical protein